MLGRSNKSFAVSIAPSPDKYNLSASLEYLYPSVKKKICQPSILEKKVEHIVAPGPGSYNIDVPIKYHGIEYHKPTALRRETRSVDREIRLKSKPEKSEIKNIET